MEDSNKPAVIERNVTQYRKLKHEFAFLYKASFNIPANIAS